MADEFSEARGREMAVAMLRELGKQWDSMDLEGVPDDEISETMIAADPVILRRYLAAVRRSGSAALERGFLCVVSNFIGGEVAAGTCVSLEFYERGRGAP